MFSSVVASNFEAVALLRCGRFEESVALLKKASMAIKAAGADPSQFGQGASAAVVSVPLLEDFCAEETFFSFHKTALVKETAPYDLFMRAFVVDEEAQPLLNTFENACICASVCLYNMALNMHMKGLISGQSGFLRKASALYEKVFAILSNYSPEPTETVTTLLLANVLNSIACESELQGHNSTYKWKRMYKELFCWMAQCAHTPAFPQQPEEFDFFTVSFLLYTNENLIAAATA